MEPKSPAIAAKLSTVKRSTKVRNHSGIRKEDQERAIGELLASGWSLMSGNNWKVYANHPQDSDVDLELVSDGYRPARAQLTRAQPADSWELKIDETYETNHTMTEAGQEILSAIQTKVAHLPERQDLILVLDAYILPFPESVLRRVSLDNLASLEVAGFEEIWYVALQPKMVVRLYPGFHAVEFPQESEEQHPAVSCSTVGGVRIKRSGSSEWETPPGGAIGPLSLGHAISTECTIVADMRE